MIESTLGLTFKKEYHFHKTIALVFTCKDIPQYEEQKV